MDPDAGKYHGKSKCKAGPFHENDPDLVYAQRFVDQSTCNDLLRLDPATL